MQWDFAIYTREPYLDTDFGRYIIRHTDRGKKGYRAFLNNARTSFTGTIPEVQQMVERAVRSQKMK